MVMARSDRTESWIGSYTTLLNKKDDEIKELKVKLDFSNQMVSLLRKDKEQNKLRNELEELKEQVGMANVLIMIGKKNIEHRTHGGVDHFNTYEKKYLTE